MRLALLCGLTGGLAAASAVSSAQLAKAASGPGFVQGGGTTSSALTLSKPVSSGDLLVAGVTTNGGDISGVSDSLNGTWTRAASVAYGNGHVDLYYLQGSRAGSDRITTTGNGTRALSAAEYSGVASSTALDQIVGAATGGSTLTAGPTAAIGAAGELVVGTGGQTYVGSGFRAGSGFALRETANAPWLAANGLEDMLSASPSGQSMTMGVGSSVGHGYAGAIVAVFKAASVGPSAALALSPASAPAGTQITADASGSSPGANPISTYSFDFGDGTTTTPQASPTATHTYASGGVFTVTVTVTDSGGGSAQATAKETVGAPAASLKVTPSSGSAPLTVSLDASASTDAPGVPISSYTFNFGDGTTLGPQASASASHIYSVTGSYTASVTVADGTGASSTATAQVSVTNGPTAVLTLNPAETSAGTPVTADASGSTAGSASIATYSFDFGDGSAPVTLSAPADTAAHTYSVGGVYTVTVTVTDSAGHSSQATAQETVGQPSAALTVTPSSGGAPLQVTADASGSTDATGVSITGYAFNFGDGSAGVNGTASTAGHLYTAVGTYSVVLTITDTAGATATATQSVTVAAPPSAALTVSPTSGTVPLSISADASGSTQGFYPISTYTFDFGDGTTLGPQTQDTAAHTYTSAGNFTVTLTVTDSAGLTSSATQTVSATSTYLVQDTFQRANQSGWGAASDGLTWSSGSALSISGDEGLISYSGTSQFETLGSTTTADGNGLVRFSIAASNDTAGILLRDQSSGNWALARYNGAGGNLQFIVRVGSSTTTVSQTAVSVSLNSYYWLRFEVQGSSAYLKLWADGTTEPRAWTWSGSSSLLTSAGTMGLYGWASSGAPVRFDSFSVAPVSALPPTATISGTVTSSAGGAGIAGVTVSTIPASTTATTGATGTYSLPVAAGTYTVVFTASSLGYNNNDAAGITAPASGSVTASQALVPIPAQVAMDTFTQPDQSGGWSPSTDGHTWTSDIGSPPNGVPINGAGITGNQAWVDASGNTSQDLDTWMGYSYADQQVTADIDITNVVSDPTYQHGPRLLARVQGSATSWNAIIMTIDPPNGSNPTCPGGDVSLWVTIPSTWTELAMVCETVSLNTLYHAQLEVVGNLVEGNLWTGSTPPSGWQITATQSLLNGAGQAGTRTTGSYVDWANFQQTPVTQISGQVTSAANGAPVSGATVTLSNGLYTTTDSNGNYSFSGLPPTLPGGSTYTVTASATGYTNGSASVTPPWGGTGTADIGLT